MCAGLANGKLAFYDQATINVCNLIMVTAVVGIKNVVVQPMLATRPLTLYIYCM